MKLILTVWMITLSIFCNAQSHSEAQCHPKLEKYTHGFNSLVPDSFAFLDNELRDVRIVGHGEDTHGTAEFTTLAEVMMNYLFQKHGFTILILETSFGEGAYLNDYIQGKRNDLNVILEEYNSTWRYQTKEFQHLMNWLRQHNQNNSDKIYIYGCEMQYVVSDVRRVKDYLKQAGSSYQIDGFEKHLWQNIDESEKSDYYVSYAKLKAHFLNNQEAFISKTSEKEYRFAYHQVEVLGQFVTAINQSVEQRKHDFRDIYMGENIQWILNFHGDNSKALYWAHNAHIGDWVSNGIVDVTGHQLKKMYGDSYFAIATDFGTGEFIAYPGDANNETGWEFQTFSHDSVAKNTLSDCLKKFGKPNAFLNIRKAKNDNDLKSFLEKPLSTMCGAGAQFWEYEVEASKYGNAFDGIIYLDKTHKITWKE